MTVRPGVRSRFALLAAGLALVISCLVGLFGYLALKGSLVGQAEREARDQARQLRSLIDTGVREAHGSRADQGGNLVSIADRSLTREFTAAGMLVSVFRPDGSLIQSSPRGPAPTLSPSLRSSCLAAGEASAHAASPPLAVDCVRVGSVRAPRGLVTVGAPLSPAQQSLADLARALAIGIGGGVVLALALSYLAAHRALRPARRIAEAAEAIRSGDLARRIGFEGRRDELGRLADELDSCFAELEGAVERQRRFIADASHQLKTPIAAMRANVELLRSWAATSPAARRAALTSLDAAFRGAARVVADLLYLAGLERRPAATTAPVHLDEVVVNAVREAQALRPEVPIEVDRLDEADAMGDELRLQQLLVNLLDNALGVSPDGAAVNVSLEATAGTARVTVSDRGQGIPPDELERIFERFHRANGSRGAVGGGTGLGLAIARSIAREHGGEVFAHNREGGGAAFVLELPAHRLLPTRSPVPP